MSRPSHWLLISLAVFASVVTATGSWRRVLAGPRVDHWVQQREAQAERAVERGQTVELFGIVVDRLGRPVVGAAIELADRSAEALSDPQGRFVLSANGRRGHPVAIRAPGKAPLVGRVVVPGSPLVAVLEDARPWSDEAPLEAVPQGNEDGHRVANGASMLVGEGFVEDSAGDAVAFAQVAVRETGATVVADASGRFQVPLPTEGAVTLIASDRAGQVAQSKPFQPSRRQGKVPVAELVLRPGHAMRGFVRDASGRVCDGAIVIAKLGEVEHIAITGLRGDFEIAGLCGDAAYDVHVLPHRGQLGDHRREELGARDLDLDLTLRAPTVRKLRVVSSANGPLAHAHVVSRDGLSVAYAQADAEGFVTLQSVGATPMLEVRGQDLARCEIERVSATEITVR